jgi:HEAT repeat protein
VTPLTHRERARGKRWYYVYGVFNSLSYPVLAENVVTLVLLRLGGTETWVGATSALLYVTLPCMLLGYFTIPRLGVAKTAGLWWAIRSVSATLMIAAPWAADRLGVPWGLWLLFLGSLGFNIGRSAGVASFTGIVTELTTVKDRGDLIATSMRVSQAGAMAVSIAMAVLLGPEAHAWRYQAFFAVGVVAGLLAAWGLWRIPESGAFRAVPPFSLAEQLRWLTETQGRRWFFAMTMVIPITQGIVKTFIVLVAKQGYHLPDRFVLLYVMIGVGGGIAASYAYGLFMDKLGSRPLLVLTGFIDIASVALVVLLPARLSYLLLGVAFFLSGYANIAYQASMQHYFIAIANRRQQIPLGIVTQGIGGIVAGLALYAGGWSLEALREAAPLAGDPLLHFRWFFGALLALMAVRTVILLRLPRLQSQGVRDALSALISPGDWRAAHAVRRALSEGSEDQETRALEALRSSTSAIYQEDLRHYLDSPSYIVRERAMESLRTARPTPALIQALMEDLRVNRFLTAHLAAECLGRWQVKEAAPLLQNVVFSRDFTLSAKAIHALVELGEQDVAPLIEVLFTASENPLVLIEGARALSLWGGEAAYPLLLDKYALDLPPQAKDELSLAIARLMGLYDALYRDLGMLHRDRAQLEREWRDRLRAAREPDLEDLVGALHGAPLDRAGYRAAIGRRQARLSEAFVRTTLERLDTLSDPLDAHLALLLSFLLLTPQGNQWRAPAKAAKPPGGAPP